MGKRPRPGAQVRTTEQGLPRPTAGDLELYGHGCFTKVGFTSADHTNEDKVARNRAIPDDNRRLVRARAISRRLRRCLTNTRRGMG